MAQTLQPALHQGLVGPVHTAHLTEVQRAAAGERAAAGLPRRTPAMSLRSLLMPWISRACCPSRRCSAAAARRAAATCTRRAAPGAGLSAGRRSVQRTAGQRAAGAGRTLRHGARRPCRRVAGCGGARARATGGPQPARCRAAGGAPRPGLPRSWAGRPRPRRWLRPRPGWWRPSRRNRHFGPRRRGQCWRRYWHGDAVDGAVDATSRSPPATRPRPSSRARRRRLCRAGPLPRRRCAAPAPGPLSRRHAALRRRWCWGWTGCTTSRRGCGRWARPALARPARCTHWLAELRQALEPGTATPGARRSNPILRLAAQPYSTIVVPVCTSWAGSPAPRCTCGRCCRW